jgi:hypothetical protein
MTELNHMSITRTTLLAGPATASFGGRTFVAREGILVSPALELKAVDSDAQGVLDATATVAPVRIQFTPQAGLGDLLALYPFLEGAPGTPLFGAEDSPLVLVAANGVRLTFAAAALLQMPDLSLGARGAVAGAVTFLALGARALPITAANRLVAIDTVAPPMLPAVTPNLSDDYVIAWGEAMPWLELRAREGIEVKFAMKWRPVLSAANALLDMTLESLTVTARFTPASPDGPGEADVFAALQAQGALPGRLLSQLASGLVIAGEHLWVQLPLAQLSAGALTFDATHSRVGELEFTATRALIEAEQSLSSLATLSEGEPV